MKNALLPVRLVADGSMAASITSDVLPMQYMDNIGIQLDWTGSPVGTIEVQVSLNHQVNPDGSTRTAGTWVTLPSASFTGTYPIPGTTSSPAYLDLPLLSAAFLRVVYNRTSGSGTLNVIAVGKGV